MNEAIEAREKVATPRPWYFDSKDGFNNSAEREASIGGICADEWIIAAVENDGPSPEADADFIIQAVNWHDALLAELRARDKTLEAVKDMATKLPPLDWEPRDEWGDYAAYPCADGRFSSVDETNQGDVHCHGIAAGEQVVRRQLDRILQEGK